MFHLSFDDGLYIVSSEFDMLCALDDLLTSFGEADECAHTLLIVLVGLPPQIAYAYVGRRANPLVFAMGIASFAQTLVTQEEQIEGVALRTT